MRQKWFKGERAKPGEAIQSKWRTPPELAKLNALIVQAKKAQARDRQVRATS